MIWSTKVEVDPTVFDPCIENLFGDVDMSVMLIIMIDGVIRRHISVIIIMVKL